MRPQPPDTSTPDPHRGLRQSLRRLAWLTDEALPVPGTHWRIGLDALLGFVPVIGDAAGFFIGLYLVSIARAHGVPAEVQQRMLRNLGLELLVGFVPLLGDVFDIAFRANSRNRQLVEDWLAEQTPAPLRPARDDRLRHLLLIALVLGVMLAGLWFLLVGEL